MNPTVLGWALTICLVAGGAGYWYGESKGHQRGVLETQSAHDSSQVASLTEGLRELRASVEEGAAVSKSVRTTLSGLELQNKNSNTELKNAIAKSLASGAVVCRFDADSMRILGAAADRADALAAGGLAAGGTRRALPGRNTASR
ncbi:hypothetical protein [Achromobacter denitrificans]|uniref:DUF2570 domain-containing protein n=1 Tax=Achromobacter denitrificans TaxID=32002 RepID=A0ABZ3FX53_ACHDE